jgi:hypothetical protein
MNSVENGQVLFRRLFLRDAMLSATALCATGSKPVADAKQRQGRQAKSSSAEQDEQRQQIEATPNNTKESKVKQCRTRRATRTKRSNAK